MSKEEKNKKEKWICEQFLPYPRDKGPIQKIYFNTEKEAMDFYISNRSARRWVGSQAPYWTFPRKVIEE